MRRMLIAALFGVFLTDTTYVASTVFAQTETTTRERIASEFARVYDRWKRSKDREERRGLFRHALQLEAELYQLTSADAETENWLRSRIWTSIGVAYAESTDGNRADNQELAIAAYEQALKLIGQEAFPQDWASIQNNLANAYIHRVKGDRADNLERAIAHHEAALTVRTRDAYPRSDWARSQGNLGVAYYERIHGDRADNLEKAISHFSASLTVFTREAWPYDWAEMQNNIGAAYANRLRGDRADNVEEAIKRLELALTVRTQKKVPTRWAKTQIHLGVAYALRIRGNIAENVEKAIAAFQAGMTVITRDRFPDLWADTQSRLGDAYQDRRLGQRQANLQKAAAAYEAALTVRKPDVLPRAHLRTARQFGGALLAAKEWSKAQPLFASARDAFLILFGEGLNEAEGRNLISEAGPLFAEAAFNAAHLGQNEAALALASEGRARMMAIALKLRLDARPRVLELRTEIRSLEHTVQATHGNERIAAIEKLISRRQELLSLVKSSANKADAGAPSLALSQALDIASKGGAAVVPIVTRFGSKIVIVTQRARPGNRASFTVLDLPDLTTARLDILMRGTGRDGDIGGWLGAYNINHLKEAEKYQRWPQWLAAIGDLGPELWHLFGSQLHAALKKSGITVGSRIVWLPTGPLGLVPLGLTQNPVTDHRLVDEFEIIYAPSLEIPALTKGSNTPASLALVVNPTEDLEGTEKEGVLVASHFAARMRSQTVLKGSQATSDSVLAALKSKTHWHFASHGTFSWTHPRKSGLYLAGSQILSVERLLEAEGLGAPRLVVLSACETGLYDIGRSPDEFIGLPGAFTALGAQGVIGTLWPVPDAATALLIAKFYDYHMEIEIPPPTALRLAQLWLQQATNIELMAYARTSSERGRLKSRHLSELEQELSAEGLARSRNAAVAVWDLPKPAQKASGQTAAVARPYAHPYFWAGFIYTGL